ncbi:hypothetical protein [Microbacterium candidum]|uniref:SbsA Ig-like domain-containing protein n=1 Tax=Microbacterium candidum TaxID=3041922 RepID=A0ABT7MTQ7_9MICO|nr:hypothetical protein [Microbacterium sp. ASV49]MDL9977829.1 hypothetical protein [Microbacterium sp. ASV49]
MSTERTTRPGRRAFWTGFAVVGLVLAGVSAAGAAVSGLQGPRVTSAVTDPAAGVEASGSRVILTTNQMLHKVTPAQVTVTPATPFTVDTSGRSVGVRFTLPLHDRTHYTVRISAVTGYGGGPDSTLTTSFDTPSLDVYVLQRSSSGDAIVRTSLDGKQSRVVFRNPHIEDFRATSSHLVASVSDQGGNAHLIVTDLDGKHARELIMPGQGTILDLQMADKGELIGYTYSDASLGSTGGRESMLFTSSLKDSAAREKPEEVPVSGTEHRIADWRFVPDTDRILLLTYDGRLLLGGSGASAGKETQLGTGSQIDGIARGSSKAVIERPDGYFTIDLTNGKQVPLAGAKGIPGTMGFTTPLPQAGTARPYAQIDASGNAQGTTVAVVADDGKSTPVFSIPGTDAIVQTCSSPSGRYLAMIVTPDVVNNPFDSYALPMPHKVFTHIVDLGTKTEVSTLKGFAISWCEVPPQAVQ